RPPDERAGGPRDPGRRVRRQVAPLEGPPRRLLGARRSRRWGQGQQGQAQQGAAGQAGRRAGEVPGELPAVPQPQARPARRHGLRYGSTVGPLPKPDVKTVKGRYAGVVAALEKMLVAPTEKPTGGK